MSLQEEAMVDTVWEFLLIMGDVDECDGRILAVFINNILYHSTVVVIQSV